MCPAMTDEPISPGRGLWVYQPATDVLFGTWSVPCRVMPSWISLVCTAMAGMRSVTGGGTVSVRGLGSGAGEPSGTRPCGAALAGPGARPVRPASISSPATVTATTRAPPSSTAAASGRRATLRQGGLVPACRPGSASVAGRGGAARISARAAPLPCCGAAGSRPR